MASAKHPRLVLNCGEVDGIRCTAEVGPFDTPIHAEEAARELARIYPGSVAFIGWTCDDRNPDPAMLQAQLERARHLLAQLRA